MSSYNFAIQYRKKFENLKINVLNQRIDHMIDKSQINQTILHENQDDLIVYNRQNVVTLRVYNKDLEKKIKQELAKNLIA